MATALGELKKHVTVGVVSGSDVIKLDEQLQGDSIHKFKYVFGENGVCAYKDGQLISHEVRVTGFASNVNLHLFLQSIQKVFGDETLKRVINFTLKYIADLDIPVKRGTFIEYRSVTNSLECLEIKVFPFSRAQLNISPIGRNCSLEERNAFSELDKKQGIRAAFKKVLEEEFKDIDMEFAIGEQSCSTII